MLEPRRSESTVRPSVIENLGNGNWYYNYDIQEKTVERQPLNEGEEPVQETVYSCIQVKMAGKPDYKRCVELIIREYITQSQEFDLINTANKAAYNMLSEEESETELAKYVEYLGKVEEIKANVKADFE